MDWPRSGRAWGQQITSGLEPGTPSLLLQANLGLLPYYFIINKNTESPSSDRRSQVTHMAAPPAPPLRASWSSPIHGAAMHLRRSAPVKTQARKRDLFRSYWPEPYWPDPDPDRVSPTVPCRSIHPSTFISGEGDAQTPAGF